MKWLPTIYVDEDGCVYKYEDLQNYTYRRLKTTEETIKQIYYGKEYEYKRNTIEITIPTQKAIQTKLF